jgi:hypothetical protein
MRRYIFTALLVVTGCAPHASTGSTNPYSSDLEVYRAVLDSMFTPDAQSRFSRIAVVDSTTVFKRENHVALVQSLIGVPGVDSTVARDFAARSYEAHSLKGLSTLRLRMPVLLVDRRALAPLPRADPDKYWTEFYQRFPDTNGLISLSAIGYNADGNLGVLMVDVGCGGLCGNGYIVVAKRESGKWYLATILNTWVS